MSANERYRAQVDLLIRCLPAVAKVRAFALKGGTAINLFHHDMPRLSVDIDLTFLPITDRGTALAGITEGLAIIGEEIRRTIPRARTFPTGTDAPKLQVATPHARIKVEPSPISRGSLFPPFECDLCQAAQNEYELLAPNTKPIEQLYTHHFAGMTAHPIKLNELEATREKMFAWALTALSENERKFLLSIKQGEPDWSLMPFEHLQQLPAIQWKLRNVRQMSARAHTTALDRLRVVLDL